VVIRNGAVLHAAPPDYTELDYTPFGERIPVAQPPGEAAGAAVKVANGGHRADDAPGGIGDSVALASRRKLQRAFSGFYESDLFPVRAAAPNPTLSRSARSPVSTRAPCSRCARPPAPAAVRACNLVRQAPMQKQCGWLGWCRPGSHREASCAQERRAALSSDWTVLQERPRLALWPALAGFLACAVVVCAVRLAGTAEL